MKRLAIAALSLAALTTPAHADTAAVCTFEGTIHVSPGVTSEPHATEFTTHGETGSIDCSGFLGGAATTGPGTIGFEGIGGYGWLGGETCAQDTSTGSFSATIPAGLFETHIEGLFTAQRVGVVGVFEGTVRNVGSIKGTFQFEAAEGQDCVETPITEATVTGQAIIAG